MLFFRYQLLLSIFMETVAIAKLLTSIALVMISKGRMSGCHECDDYLISGLRGIQDSQLSASSFYPNDEFNLHDPKYGRLNLSYKAENGSQAAAWSSLNNNDQQYIQAIFSSVKKIKSILIQGRSTLEQWVTSYYVSYSTDGFTWSNVLKPDNTTMIFPGNTDQSTVVNNTLPEHVEAKYLRIHPKTWHEHISLRFDVIGCTVCCHECDDYLISGPRGIQDSQLSASSFYPNTHEYFHDPKYGRLYLFYKAKNGAEAAAWSSKNTNDPQYIQAMFSSVKIVKAILTQGRRTYMQWVTSYYVSYSTDDITWSNVLKPDKTTMIFPGNTDPTSVISNTLPYRVEAKYLRIHPKTWYNHISLRFDVIGCTLLTMETFKNQLFWTRHPIELSSIVFRSIRKSIQPFSLSKIDCGVQCLKNDQCLMFSFNKNLGTCTGFPSQVYQRQKSANSSSEKDQYFISFRLYVRSAAKVIYGREKLRKKEKLGHLNAYEYEIVESKMFSYKIFTWSTSAESAFTRCQKEGARLLSIHDVDQMEYVQNKIKGNLILSKHKKYYVDGSKKDGKWRYSTGIDIPTELWAPSQPVASNDNCVTLTLAGLQTDDCNDLLYFVCGV